MKRALHSINPNIAPWVVLACSLMITCMFWRAEEAMVAHQAEARFEQETKIVESAIAERLHTYELMLQGCVALFYSSEFIDRQEWKIYVQSLDPHKNYPGIQGIGFAKRVPAPDKEAHIRQLRAEGFPDYTIRPAGNRAEYFPIIYLEPFGGRNLRAFSYDMFSEEVRRTAMELARDRGVTSISGKVTLVQETTEDIQHGFLMYVPLYEKNRPLTTVEQRRAALRGFPYSPFRVNDFMKGIFKSAPETIYWEIYDGRAPGADALLYRSGDAAPGASAACLYEKASALELFGRTWTLQFKTLPAFEAAIDRSRLLFIVGASLFSSILLFGITFLLVGRGKTLARDIARREHLEKALRESEQCVQKKLASILEPTADIGSLELSDILDIDAVQQLMDRFCQLTGVGGSILDLQGNVLVQTGWQDICTKFHRRNPGTLRNCLECDTVLSRGVEPGTFKTYLCKNSMYDCVTPLVVGGRHMGNLFTGQFFFEDGLPDENVFRAQAARYGFNEAQYLAALKRVPVFTRETISTALDFYSRLATMISSLSHGNIVLAKLLEDSRRADAALRASEGKYRSLFEGMSQGAFIQDADGKLIDINPAGLRIFGLTRDEFLGRDSYCPAWQVVREDGTLLSPEEHPSMVALFSGQPVHDAVYGLFSPQANDFVWLITNAIPQVLPGERKPFQVFVTLHDITLRKKAEAERALLAEIIEGSLNEIYLFSAQTLRFHYANKGALKNLGYTLDEIKSLTPLDLKPGFTPEAFLQLLAPFMRNDLHTEVFETMHRRADGSLYPVEVHLQFFNRAEESLYLAIIQDITERKLAQETLKNSEYRLKSILNNIPDIAWLKDAERTYIAVNDACAKAAGWLQAEIPGKIDEDLWPPELAAQYRSDDLQVMQSGQRLVVEETLCDHDGTPRFMEAIKTPFYDDKGALIGIAGIARDITERRKMAEQLIMASNKWLATFDGMIDPVTLLTPDGTIEQCNRAFADFVGLDFPAVLGRKCYHLTHHGENFIADCPVIRAAQSRRRETVELPCGEKSFLVIADPILASGGSLRGFVHIMRDITESKKAEEALQESEEKFKAIANYTVDWESWFGLDGEYLWVNPGVEHITGYTAQEIMAMPDFKEVLVAPEDRVVFAEQFGKAMQGSPGKDFECRYFHKNGTARWLSASWQPIFDSKGNALGTRASGRDITDRKEAENALLESQRSLNTMISNLQGFVYRCVNDRNWSMQFISAGVKDVTGYDSGDFIDNARIMYASIIDPDDRAFVYDEIQKAVQERRQFQLTYRIRTAAGQVKWMLEKGVGVFSPAGELVCLEGFITDITGRKLAEQSLQEKNTELERFTYSISHDLKSPLVTIRTFLGHLGEDIRQRDQQRITQDMTFIDTAAGKMNKMLDELLQLSRIGRVVNPFVETPLQEILQEALAMVAGLIDQRRVRVQVTDEPALLYGDRSRLMEVFQNLIDNAVKFMGGQPEPLIEIGVRAEKGFLELFVRDNGMGIDPRHKEKLFGLFEKINPGLEGTGLGLALAKRIVEVHGGRIRAESEGLGKGSCFWFSLPCKPVQG